MFGLKTQPLRIGWIIQDQLDKSRFYSRINVNIGGISLCRYNWVANFINADPRYAIHYEIFRPWKRYDGLIFLKSMGKKSRELIKKYQEKGRPVLFDANVNYYEISGKEYYQGMLPTEIQKNEAIEITRTADGIIADSEFLRSKCAGFNSRVCWISDSVHMEIVPPYRPWSPKRGRITLLWSGESLKLFELLVLEDILYRHASHLELVMVTNDFQSINRWYPDYRKRFETLLERISHRFIPYQSIEHLFEIYAQGGIIISPRFLDNSYNLGHTEWKITLGMACGRMALCSPVPSYVLVNSRAKGSGIRICRSLNEWEAALEEIITNNVDLEKEEKDAKSVVETYYATSVVAQDHAAFVKKVINRDW